MPGQRRQELASELRGRGLRATRQRIAILRALRARGGHPTAAEVHRRARRTLPDLSLKTVYEALDDFVTAGLAGVLMGQGPPARYDPTVAPHYHARCRACGRLEDVPLSSGVPGAGAAALPRGFEAEGVEVTFVGRCQRCAGAA